MKLLEFQAKRLLTEYGIPAPPSVLITSLQDLNLISFPAVLKAQVPIGGRGKAGAIRIVRNSEEAAASAKDLFLATVKGYPVHAILAEELIKANGEFYVAYLIDKQANLPILMASPEGGVEIEEIARRSPEKIIKKHIDPFLGVQDFIIWPLAKALKVDFQSLKNFIQPMVRLFHEQDAALIEINPLAVTSKGLVALDAKILVDDKAAYRQRHLFDTVETEQKLMDKRARTRSEELVEGTGIAYVPLDGDIGIIADGAGTGMLTLDLVYQFGGRAANFCEMGGLSNAETMEKSIRAILANPRVKVLFIGLIGGMTRMDKMAEGIIQYLRKEGKSVPLVVRMCGTKADVGRASLREAGIDAHEDLSAAVRDAVDRAQGG